jgi:hypothetical protein
MVKVLKMLQKCHTRAYVVVRSKLASGGRKLVSGGCTYHQPERVQGFPRAPLAATLWDLSAHRAWWPVGDRNGISSHFGESGFWSFIIVSKYITKTIDCVKFVLEKQETFPLTFLAGRHVHCHVTYWIPVSSSPISSACFQNSLPIRSRTMEENNTNLDRKPVKTQMQSFFAHHWTLLLIDEIGKLTSFSIIFWMNTSVYQMPVVDERSQKNC